MLFRAKTSEGHVIKMLSELTQLNMKTTVFRIDKHGITMRVPDAKMWSLFDLDLKSENFQVFEFESDGPLNIGLNLKYLYKMLKIMKKKDTIELYIQDPDVGHLGIRVIPRENNRISDSQLKIHNIQMLDIDLPTGYDLHINIVANDFQKMVKDLCSISNTIKVTATRNTVTFSCLVDNVYAKQITFGGDIFDTWANRSPQNTEVMYEGLFDISQILSIIKIANFSRSILVYCKPSLPICFKTDVGCLGKFQIFIKSKDIIDEEELASKLGQ